MCLMRRIFYNPEPIRFSRDNEVTCLMAGSTVNQEDMPFLVRSTVMVLNKMVQPNHTNALICVPSWGYRHKLMPCHILMEPRFHNQYARHNNQRGYRRAVCRDALHHS